MGLTAKKVYAVLNGKIKKLSGDVSGLGTPLFYAGSVATADLLPLLPNAGAVYNIEQKSIYGEAGTNVAWNGTLWDALGPTFDLSLLLTKENAKNLYLQKNQGSENSGKFLVVGEDGNVILSDTQDGGVKTDTTLTKSGEAADAKVVGDKITTLKEDLDKIVEVHNPKNLYDDTKKTDGYRWRANGNKVALANGMYTDYIPVKNGDIVTMSASSVNGQRIAQNWLSIVAFDSSKSFIASKSSDTGANTYTVSDDVSFVVISTYKTVINLQIEVTMDGVFTDYEKYYNPYKSINEEYLSDITKKIDNYFAEKETDFEKLQFENMNLKNRCRSLEDLNKFSWSDFDKGYITLVFDDGSADLGLAYEIAQEYGLTISCAMPPERLTIPLSGSTMTGTVKDACDAIVSSGGEVLTHALSTLNREDVTEQDFYNYFVQNKIDLEKNGYEVNGIITAGAGYVDKSVSLKWARQYYLYSDAEGSGQSFPQYAKNRYLVYANTSTDNTEQIKVRITNANTQKTWLVLCFHVIDNNSPLGTNETKLRELFSLIKLYIEQGTMICTTYKFMYSHFGSTELEKRIKVLENI